MGNAQPNPRNNTGLEPEALIKVAVYFFNKALAELEVTPEKARQGFNPIVFMDWLKADVHEGSHNCDVGLELNVPISAVRYFTGLPSRQDGINALMGLWPYMLDAGREQKHEVRSINLMAVVQWSDGMVMPMSIFAHKDVLPMPLTTGDVVCLITTRSPALGERILSRGLDELHDQHQNLKGLGDASTLELLQELCEVGAARRGLTEQSPSLKPVAALIQYMKTMFPASAEAPFGNEPAKAANVPPPHSQRGGFDTSVLE